VAPSFQSRTRQRTIQPKRVNEKEKKCWEGTTELSNRGSSKPVKKNTRRCGRKGQCHVVNRCGNDNPGAGSSTNVEKKDPGLLER